MYDWFSSVYVGFLLQYIKEKGMNQIESCLSD